MLLGLTGGYCAGKNAAAAILEGRGWNCIDVDKLGHAAIDRAADAIAARFGASILGADGKVDRKALAAIVFADKRALADQEAIVHPLAVRMIDELLAELAAKASGDGREPLVCLNAALLYVAPQAALCDAIIELRAPLALRLKRAQARDGAALPVALRRIERQRGLWRRRASTGRPVVFVDNRGSREELESALERGLSEARERAARLPLGRLELS
ncbi:MAG TPA: dephospho-CoA kinase [Rectinemataceae bacterium]|nr:dephospho-CoA kinase [Rectinemataceae bacterium]